jgi:hypothetical protein
MGVKIHKIPLLFIREKKKKKTSNDLSVGQDLTENPNGLVIFFLKK